MIEEELETALARPRYGRRSGPPVEDAAARIAGHRHGRRTRSLTGTFGRTEIAVPQARRGRHDDRMEEQSAADAPIASAYLCPEPTPAGRWRPCFAALSADTGQPGLAQGKGRLGCLDRPFPR